MLNLNINGQAKTQRGTRKVKVSKLNAAINQSELLVMAVYNPLEGQKGYRFEINAEIVKALGIADTARQKLMWATPPTATGTPDNIYIALKTDTLEGVYPDEKGAYKSFVASTRSFKCKKLNTLMKQHFGMDESTVGYYQFQLVDVMIAENTEVKMISIVSKLEESDLVPTVATEVENTEEDDKTSEQ